MPTKFLAPFLLLVASAAAQNTPIPEEIPTSQLPGGLKGEIILLAKNGNQLNIAVKITNESSRSDAFILLMGEPSTFDDAGGRYGKRAISGVAWCHGDVNSGRPCVTSDDQRFFALERYTVIEKGKSITAHFQLVGDAKGQTFNLTQEIAYRFGDFDKDSALTDAAKLKTLHFGALSFTGVKPLMPDVKSTIKFGDPVK